MLNFLFQSRVQFNASHAVTIAIVRITARKVTVRLCFLSHPILSIIDARYRGGAVSICGQVAGIIVGHRACLSARYRQTIVVRICAELRARNAGRSVVVIDRPIAPAVINKLLLPKQVGVAGVFVHLRQSIQRVVFILLIP